MNAQTCIRKLRYVCSTSMGTVDAHGNPQVRIINIMHVEPEKGEIYFVTARGKNFYRELQKRGRHHGAHPLSGNDPRQRHSGKGA